MESRYERYFSNFLSENLPSSSEGMWITDIDFVLYNTKSQKFCIIEVKTRGNQMKEWQRTVYREIHRRLMETNKTSQMKFVGSFLIEFEGDTFQDGRVWLTGTGVKKIEVYSLGFADFIYDQIS